MDRTAQKFIDCLDEAKQLLENHPAKDFTGTDLRTNPPSLESFDLTLFEEWSTFSETEFSQKPSIRLVQHLSCTGGTLICKCLAGMPNVTLLSEVNPLSQLHVSARPRFAPTDLTYLALQAKFPQFDELSKKIFKADIGVISRHARQTGKYLIVREHSHSDYLVGDSFSDGSVIKSILQDDHQLMCILTVRHPVDSYLSVVATGWTHFKPASFDEYCRRYLIFIDQNADVPLYKYEDFVEDPASQLRNMCQSLALPFNEDFIEIFDLNRLSGDSGRASNTIEKRKRRKFDKKFENEINESSNYLALCERLDYPASLNDPANTAKY
jgi:hypothetical protein